MQVAPQGNPNYSPKAMTSTLNNKQSRKEAKHFNHKLIQSYTILIEIKTKVMLGAMFTYQLGSKPSNKPLNKSIMH